jgi:hypothetical protein
MPHHVVVVEPTCTPSSLPPTPLRDVAHYHDHQRMVVVVICLPILFQHRCDVMVLAELAQLFDL